MPIMFIRHCKTIFNHYGIWAPDNHIWEVVTFDPEGHYKWFRKEDELAYRAFIANVVKPLIERYSLNCDVVASDSDRVKLSVEMLKSEIEWCFKKVLYSSSLRERYGGPYIGLPLSRYYEDEKYEIFMQGNDGDRPESHEDHSDRLEIYLWELPPRDAKLWELALSSPDHLLICVGHAFTNAAIQRLMGVEDVSPQDNLEVRFLRYNSLDNSLTEETVDATGETKSRVIYPASEWEPFPFGGGHRSSVSR